MRLSARSALTASIVAAGAMALTPRLLDAHARLVRSSPAANARLATSPNALNLWFSERPELGFTRLRLLDSAGVEIPIGVVAAIDGSLGITAPIPSTLINGRYAVEWRTAAADGHATSGRFTFVVDAAVIPPAAAPTSAFPVLPALDTSRAPPKATSESARSATFSAAIHWAELVAVLVLIGTIVFRLLVLREAALSAIITEDAAQRARQLAQAGLALFVVTTLWRLSAQSELVMVPGMSRHAAMRMVIHETTWGGGWFIGALGAVAAGVGLFLARRAKAGWIVATIGVIAVCCGEGLTGHSGVLRHRVALALAADVAHMLGAGGWLGGLTAMLLCGFPATRILEGSERTRAGQGLVRAYHRAAVECVVIVLITATIAVYIRFTSPADLWMTAYGRILLLKIALVAAVLAFGAYHRKSVVLRPWTDDTGFRFQRTATAELLVGAMVLGATAVLVSTALPSP